MFRKGSGSKTLSVGEALEEALCFGCIDERMQRIDSTAYRKYFAPRRQGSKWSDKNKSLTEKLERLGRMMDVCRAKIREARENERRDAPKPPPVTEEQLSFVADLPRGHEPAYPNFEAMPPSVRRTYTKDHFPIKTQVGIAKYLVWMIGRLDRNLKPM